MPKYIGDVDVTLQYTILDLEVEADNEGEAESKFKAIAEGYDSNEILNCGDWTYDVSLETDEDESEETE